MPLHNNNNVSEPRARGKEHRQHTHTLTYIRFVFFIIRLFVVLNPLPRHCFSIKCFLTQVLPPHLSNYTAQANINRTPQE